ncbi:hypothetical protein AAFF_G00217190 [Aldrovandia affinis]|uniref:Uncharacterized protein n=1 Tax=Aldrovandia affinis TaxID=143900 RepID=A0AAD7SVW2_9TELE|nr:hypothetical protein AAFF_G00217190 [Aldrovandia affinis]
MSVPSSCLNCHGRYSRVNAFFWLALITSSGEGVWKWKGVMSNKGPCSLAFTSSICLLYRNALCAPVLPFAERWPGDRTESVSANTEGLAKTEGLTPPRQGPDAGESDGDSPRERARATGPPDRRHGRPVSAEGPLDERAQVHARERVRGGQRFGPGVLATGHWGLRLVRRATRGCLSPALSAIQPRRGGGGGGGGGGQKPRFGEGVGQGRTALVITAPAADVYRTALEDRAKAGKTGGAQFWPDAWRSASDKLPRELKRGLVPGPAAFKGPKALSEKALWRLEATGDAERLSDRLFVSYALLPGAVLMLLT